MILRASVFSKTASIGRACESPERVIGPDYYQTKPVYMRYNSKGRSPYLKDEAYDYLDSGVLPHRIDTRKHLTTQKKKKSFDDFARTARESFMVSHAKDGGGRRTLYHVVRPGRSHERSGERDTTYGPRVVPPADDIADLIAWVRYGDELLR